MSPRPAARMLALPATFLLAAASAFAGGVAKDMNSAEDFLRELEAVGENIRSLSADIRYDRQFRLQGDRHVRTGRLFYASNNTPDGGIAHRAFAIEFDTLELFPEQRLEDDPQTWVFDGRWLVEKRPALKQFRKREIAPPGADFDPLRIGEGPMPIPIGQRAEDVLERYNAELLEAQEGLDPESDEFRLAGGAWRIRLTPHEWRKRDDDFRSIDLWYRRDNLLPRMAHTVNRSGDESWVVLLNVKTGEPLPDDVISVDPPEDDEGWDVQIETIQRERGE